MSKVPAGTYRVAVRRIGYQPFTRDVRVQNSDTSVVLLIVPNAQRLAPVRVGAKGAGIFGIVAAASDLKPLADATVMVAGTKITVYTDTSGGFFVPVRLPGTYIVRITRPWFADEVFPVTVSENQVVDASTLLEASNKKPARGWDGLWTDFDQRLRWRGVNSALVTGADVRRGSSNLIDGLQASPSFRSMKIGPTTCVLVDGIPRPNLPLDALDPDDIIAVEVYGDDKRDVAFKQLSQLWPLNAPCSQTDRSTTRPRGLQGTYFARFVVIWTKH